MGTDVAEVAETLPYPCSFKVHRKMCAELMKLVERITRILPEIEASRPGCSSGIQELCFLNSALEKAKLLLQHCSESSKLYLAVTGDVIVSRHRRSRNLLEQSLGQIQTMVPVMLAIEISRIIEDLRTATFILDSSEEEAGKVVRELLQQGASASDSMEYSEIKALQLAASRLYITSPKAILIEKRSIMKLLDKVSDSDPRKTKILKYFLYLLKKYGNLIMGEQTENASAQREGYCVFENSCNNSVRGVSVEAESVEGYGQYEAQTNLLSRTIYPEEFKCPISLRLMYDPVVIASGQTFERMWIQKWFDDGNDTCPKTEMKLADKKLTPNMVMADLISKWCTQYGITISDPNRQPESLQSLETSSTSIASFGSSMNNLHLAVDVSNISLGSLDASYSSYSAHAKTGDGLRLMPTLTNDDSHGHQSYVTRTEADVEFLSRLDELHWESKCRVVEEVKCQLKYTDQACHFMSSESSVEPLIRFLRDACDLHDVGAQRAGYQLLLAFVSKNRSGIRYLPKDAFNLLASFLDSEVTEEVLSIMEVLSGHPYCISRIAASGALASILKILDSHRREFQERAIKILHNLSSNKDICSHIVSLECIPKLVPFLKDTTLAGHCIIIMKNLCDIDEARRSVTETTGCLASVAELLETDSCEDQEHAVAVLLSLCSQRVQYCQLVMEEGVIPALVNISINGNDKGKVSAQELLRLLRDIPQGDAQECFGSDLDASRDTIDYSKEKKLSSKTPGFLGMKFSMFSKPSSTAPRKKK